MPVRQNCAIHHTSLRQISTERKSTFYPLNWVATFLLNSVRDWEWAVQTAEFDYKYTKVKSIKEP